MAWWREHVPKPALAVLAAAAGLGVVAAVSWRIGSHSGSDDDAAAVAIGAPAPPVIATPARTVPTRARTVSRRSRHVPVDHVRKPKHKSRVQSVTSGATPAESRPATPVPTPAPTPAQTPRASPNGGPPGGDS
jgi:hypothetical protein